MNFLLGNRKFLDVKLISEQLDLSELLMLCAVGLFLGICVSHALWFQSSRALKLISDGKAIGRREIGGAHSDEDEFKEQVTVEPEERKRSETPELVPVADSLFGNEAEPADFEDEPNTIAKALGAGAVGAAAAAFAEKAQAESRSIEKPVERGLFEDTTAAGMFVADPEPFDSGEIERIVYIMDVSRSLTDGQLEMSKQELIYALSDLYDRTDNAEYQVIFFSSATWFAHQRMTKGGDQWEEVEISDDGESHQWVRDTTGLKYDRGNHNLPVGDWRELTLENIDDTVCDIEAVEKSYGTTWHLPFMLAMNLEPAPSTIYFHTDGETAKQDLVADGILELVERRGGKTKINTIGFMARDAAKPLEAIAKQSGGAYKQVSKPRRVAETV